MRNVSSVCPQNLHYEDTDAGAHLQNFQRETLHRLPGLAFLFALSSRLLDPFLGQPWISTGLGGGRVCACCRSEVRVHRTDQCIRLQQRSTAKREDLLPSNLETCVDVGAVCEKFMCDYFSISRKMCSREEMWDGVLFWWGTC